MHDLRNGVLSLIIKHILNVALFELSEFGIPLLFGLRNTGDIGASAATATSKSPNAGICHISENISCSLTSKHCGIKHLAVHPQGKYGHATQQCPTLIHESTNPGI